MARPLVGRLLNADVVDRRIGAASAVSLAPGSRSALYGCDGGRDARGLRRLLRANFVEIDSSLTSILYRRR